MTHTPSPTDPDLSHVGPRDKAEILAQALPYIRKFHGKTLVIKYGGGLQIATALNRLGEEGRFVEGISVDIALRRTAQQLLEK